MEKLPHFGNPVEGKTTVERKAVYRIQRRQRRRVAELLQMVSRNKHFLASARPRAVAQKRPNSTIHLVQADSFMESLSRSIQRNLGRKSRFGSFPPHQLECFCGSVVEPGIAFAQ